MIKITLFYLFYFIFCFIGSSMESTVPKRFTRESISIQIDLALRVADKLKKNVYVYDNDEFFATGFEMEIVDNIRVKTKKGSYAVLSQAAQAVFANDQHYRQYADKPLCDNRTGLYVQATSKPANTG
ncbi:unnamed protein product [Psylliodes chrysocephalus]|uniref:Nonstructural protein WIV domain-containing protein n=1 Tax=Psylliodes chrysocephalus TaxID=3402493 RepID=A0A9P0D572_9CUCU|nr:unnamed protein product [Psylliodes chrysocephala]